MKILHTSDWHLGKYLENASRLEEQEKFLEDFKTVLDEENIDLVIIAGDIYDNSNPPAKAERLFYKTLKDITKNGQRMVLIISGNHDNPERLVAANPLAYEEGVIMLATPKSIAEIGKCGQHNIIDAGEGYVEIEIKGEKAVVLTIPYPSEKRLNEVIYEGLNDEDRAKSYVEKMKMLFSGLEDKYRRNTINLFVSHLFVIGGQESDSERGIQLGGSLAVPPIIFPRKAQYVALGHLHKPQVVNCEGDTIIRYSGSPLPYSKSEIGYSKGAYILDIHAGDIPDIKQIYFKNYKPIEVWKCNGVDEAIKRCQENKEREVWVYLEIKTDKYITEEEIKTMKEIKKDILEFRPIIINEENSEDEFESYTEKSFKDLFEDFYKKERGVEASEEVVDLFLKIALGEDEE